MVVLFVLVLAVLLTVLLCVRHGMCSCSSKKPPPNHAPVKPAARLTGAGGGSSSSSRANRSPLVSTSSVRSSQRGGGHSTHSPNFYSHHTHHSHHHHHHHHSQHSHHLHHSHSSPRRHNGHVGSTDRTVHGTNSGTSIGGSSSYSQHHHPNMRSASMDGPLPSNISPYPGMPFPYQPCKSPMTPYSAGYTTHPQIPRTPTSASITTLSSLSTAHNQRQATSNGGVGGREKGGRETGEQIVIAVGVARNHTGWRERGAGDRRVAGEGREVTRGGGRGVEEQGRGDGGGVRREDGERGRRGGTEGEVRELNSGSGGNNQMQRQVESSDSNSTTNSSPLQLYSTQV